MTTTFEDIEIEKFPYPPHARDGLKAVIDAAHEYIQSSIVLFASGWQGGQPDMISWLAKNDLLSKEGLELTQDGAQDLPPGTSAMVDTYEDKKELIQDRAGQLRMQNKNVNEHSFASFDVSNQAFRTVKKTANDLRNELGKPRKVIEGPEGKELAPEEASEVLTLVLEAIDRVHDTIEDADKGMQRNAGNIYKMMPDLPRNSYGPAPDAGYRTPWTPAASTVTFTPGNGTPNDIVTKAQEQLALGVHEVGNNTVVYRDGTLAPYNINDAWCASFSTWVWKTAGYNIKWTNKNYVPAIWNDAKSQGWAGHVSTAQPGDMIIFDWQGDGNPDHVGIVEAVDATGRIHTIEGNSSNQLRRNSYAMGNGALVGVVKPPTQPQPSPQPQASPQPQQPAQVQPSPQPRYSPQPQPQAQPSPQPLNV
ncbi:C40 family peptidase [Nocardia paucivorans]|uniref:C40 family peptidase n=1 Tax=Nocardia paucivorans TaxID=114259 RepID=UPI000594DD20|nr:CHAP domain-containing protein [Nocardia paucivorans]